MIRRVYIGDRGILGLELDSWNSEIRIKISTISRLPPNSDVWDGYELENLDEGYLVFSDIVHFESSPPGMMPGDHILDYDIREVNGESYISILSIGRPYCEKQNTLIIQSKKSWIEDSLKQRVSE